MSTTQVEKGIESLVVLIADSNAYMRRLTRMMLVNLGAKAIYEAADGVATLEAIRTISPDVMILEWDMPVLDGREVMRIVQSPGCVSQAQPADHHAHRLRQALARAYGAPPRRARVPGEADLAEDAATSADRDSVQSAADGARRAVLHPAAAATDRFEGTDLGGVRR